MILASILIHPTICDWQQVLAVTSRELAVVAVMNILTDKSDWQVKIFDDQMVAC